MQSCGGVRSAQLAMRLVARLPPSPTPPLGESRNDVPALFFTADRNRNPDPRSPRFRETRRPSGRECENRGVSRLPRPPVRTITLFCEFDDCTDPRLQRALDVLVRLRHRAQEAGYAVQTVRVVGRLIGDRLDRSLHDRIVDVDRRLHGAGVLWTPGPQLSRIETEHFPAWASELIADTAHAFLSMAIAGGGVRPGDVVRTAARTIRAVAEVDPAGEGNFRFAAAAACRPFTPFFPVAWHDGGMAVTAALESAGVVSQVAAAADVPFERAVADALSHAAEPVAGLIAGECAAAGVRFGGMDMSPAPGLAASIGAAIERRSGVPLGHAGTLAACADIAAGVRAARPDGCGYSGLMLPVLEDRVLAARTEEGRFSVRDILLWSSVCGTGLDMVPLAGTTSEDALTRLLHDVASLALRWDKPLSVRVLPVPGTAPGDVSRFTHPLLVNTRVFGID